MSNIANPPILWKLYFPFLTTILNPKTWIEQSKSKSKNYSLEASSLQNGRVSNVGRLGSDWMINKRASFRSSCRYRHDTFSCFFLCFTIFHLRNILVLSILSLNTLKSRINLLVLFVYLHICTFETFIFRKISYLQDAKA